MMNIPNLITIGRILLVPLTVWLIISDAYGAAFVSFLAAGVSDGIDGYIARRYNLRTELGAYLDPLADKALLVSVYVTLGFLKILPAWLAILVISRDVLIVGAILLAWLIRQPLRMSPLMLSKVNTVAQILLVVAVLGGLATAVPIEDVVTYGSLLVGVLTAASGAAYLLTWIRHVSGATPEDRRP